MKYKGYLARIEYDDVDKIFVGRLAGIDAIVGFHGATVDELEQRFKEAVEHYIDVSAKLGRKPQKPYSGKLVLRMPPEIHARCAMRAEASGRSLNQWLVEQLTERLAAD